MKGDDEALDRHRARGSRVGLRCARICRNDCRANALSPIADALQRYEAARPRDDADVQAVEEIVAGAPAPLRATPGLHEVLVPSRVDNRWQLVAVYVPPSLKPGKAPLAIALHGNPESESHLLGMPYLRRLADSTGTIVVAPVGRGIYDLKSRPGPTCTISARGAGRNASRSRSHVPRRLLDGRFHRRCSARGTTCTRRSCAEKTCPSSARASTYRVARHRASCIPDRPQINQDRRRRRNRPQKRRRIRGRSPREPRFTSSDLHASTFGYNAAHRGAERDIFPRSGGGADRIGTLLSTSGVPMAGRRQVCRPANISRIKQSSIASRSTSRKWRSCSQATFRCPITTSARANRRSRPVATIITDSRAE